MRLSHHIGIKRDKKVRVYTSYGQAKNCEKHSPISKINYSSIRLSTIKTNWSMKKIIFLIKR